MAIYEVILLGLALAMDALAIAVANQSAYKKISRTKELFSVLSFGFAQGLLFMIGYFTGNFFLSHIIKYSGYISMSIFFILSANIFMDIFVKSGKKPLEKTLTYKTILAEALAGSIDALAVGVVFIGTSAQIFFDGGIIMLISVITIGVGVIIGKILGEKLGKYAEGLGALILLALGIKELIKLFL